ncbi:hypothetical protein PoB_000273700 [Plakobranchus ocellatus]|uniref:Uncharacterized protein n=1 Tax=Plakobranchus ocellatus TaxID=259542 RepID=A0AAV3Y0D9_9GAST|nr:hypothetical protein PoB_000273700 [Plakobranchus ocellatus]
MFRYKNAVSSSRLRAWKPVKAGRDVAWQQGNYKTLDSTLYLLSWSSRGTPLSCTGFEVKYHLKCVAAFYRWKPKLAHEEREQDNTSTLHVIAFAELSGTSKALGMPNLNFRVLRGYILGV